MSMRHAVTYDHYYDYKKIPGFAVYKLWGTMLGPLLRSWLAAGGSSAPAAEAMSKTAQKKEAKGNRPKVVYR